MIDIQFIRDNPKVVQEKSKQKGYDIDIEQLLGFDTERRELLGQVEELRRRRNELTDQSKGQRPSDEQVAKGRELKEQLADLEHRLNAIEQEFLTLLKCVPNMPLDDVPVGASEDENVITEEWGEKPQFDFKPKNHWEIAQARGWLDKDRAAKVAGSRFAYLKGGLVELQFAIVQYVFGRLTDSRWLEKLVQEYQLSVSAKPFVPVIPPMMIKTDVFDAMDRLEPRDDRYRVGEPEDDLWLQGSAEHTLGSMYMNEILPAADLPIRYVGYATSFRREAGTYGKDMEGLIRMHQFDKLEMEIFSDQENSHAEHLLLVAVQKQFMKELNIPFRVLNKCTADIGKPNASGQDIDAWLPGQNKYRETHTADYMTDYQSRRLQTRYKQADGTVRLVHTNDATALVLSRTPVAIIENYQTAEGNVRVPEVLRPYLGNREVI